MISTRAPGSLCEARQPPRSPGCGHLSGPTSMRRCSRSPASRNVNAVSSPCAAARSRSSSIIDPGLVCSHAHRSSWCVRTKSSRTFSLFSTTSALLPVGGVDRGQHVDVHRAPACPISETGIDLSRDVEIQRHDWRAQNGREVERALVEVPDVPGRDPAPFGAQVDRFACPPQDLACPREDASAFVRAVLRNGEKRAHHPRDEAERDPLAQEATQEEAACSADPGQRG